eukprot:g2910.t1
MTACIRGGDLATFFDGVDTGCTTPRPTKHVSENKKFATRNNFDFDGDTVLDGYLQSYKYFVPNIRDRIRFKQTILSDASNYLAPYESRTTVGIHVRHGDLVKYGYIQFPPNEYFINVLSHFRTKYSNAQFVVASDDPTWCSKQSFFVADDVRVVTEKHKPAIDMAILAGCNHMVMTVGTFGWWAAYLGADAKGGEVVYYDSEFKMEHPINKGNVALDDHFPSNWIGFGDDLEEKLSPWEQRLPRSQSKNDWCPSKGSNGQVFVQSLYADKATELSTTCAKIERVGGAGDGGKLLCVDDIRRNDCIVYSLGSRLDFSFEIDIVKRFGCQVHTFDCTVGTPKASQIPAGVSFHPWCVGDQDETKAISSDLGHQGESGQYYTLTTIRNKLGHSTIDLLKMDIERHEFTVVATLKDDNAPSQIAFETHLHNAYGMWGRPVSEDEWTAMWTTLSGLGYGIFAHEPNPQCLCCCEFSLVRPTPQLEHDVQRASAPNTIVTAYFDIPSKYSSKEYDAWMTNMLSLQDPMVIYTTADIVPKIERLRAHAMDRTLVVPMTLEDTWIARNQSVDYWAAQLRMDPEKAIHRSYQLFWIWLSKSWFVNEAIRTNPFHTLQLIVPPHLDAASKAQLQKLQRSVRFDIVERPTPLGKWDKVGIRQAVYLDYLIAEGHRFKRVILSDAGDVMFQQDPFENCWFPKNDECAVVVSEEDDRWRRMVAHLSLNLQVRHA